MSRERNPDPVIVYGAPRSGTTYLNAILNRHPRVHITHETRLFGWAHRALKVVPQNNEHLLSHRDAFLEHLAEELPDLIRGFYAKKWPRVTVWGDKNPHYSDSHNRVVLETIVELFPGARFIHIIRDGRDVVTSLIRKRHANGDPWLAFEDAHAKWTTNVDTGVAFGRELPADRYFELRYEDLTRDDEAAARELLGFLDLDPHERVLSFCREQREERTPFSGPTRDLAGGVGGSDWSAVLSAEEQARSLALLGEHLARYGYEAARPAAEVGGGKAG